MKLATLACLAVANLIGIGLVAPGSAAPTPPPASSAAQNPAAQSPAAQSPAAQSPADAGTRAAPAEPVREAPRKPAPPAAEPQATQRGAAPATRGSDRRRRTYAACNRASHQRNLQGGRRRRFLIRCRLGYERPRLPSVQQPAAPPQPAANPPGRRP